MVLFAAEHGVGGPVERCWLPDQAGIKMLRQDPLFASLGGDLMEQLLADDSDQTVVVRGDGLMPAVRTKLMV